MKVDVAVVGGGPAGLAAAVAIRRRERGARVVVIERDDDVGGIARYSDHTGYGMRDLHRVMSGPAYARHYATKAERAGVDVWTNSTVTGWSGSALEVTRPHGAEVIEATAVVLATGCRERPRSARLVPGSRPAGVFTTGSLQRLVARHATIGTRAVVVGAEHVSMSAVMTLAHAGVRTAAVVTELDKPNTYWGYRLPSVVRHRVPIETSVSVAEITGRGRVESVRLSDGRTIECDTVVFTGDWIPEHELARRAAVDMDRGTRGPAVDAALRTSRPGVFAVGNLLHAAETADVCALDGRHVAGAVSAWLAGAPWPERSVALRVDPPLAWVSPSVIAGGVTPPRRRVLLRTAEFITDAHLSVTQGTRVLWSGTPRGRGAPSTALSIPSTWLGDVDPTGGAVSIQVSDLR